MGIRELIRLPAVGVPARLRHVGPLLLGMGGWFVALGTYKLAGFGAGVLTLFVGSILAVGWGIHRVAASRPIRLGLGSVDLLGVLFLLTIFIPLYLVELYRLPYPIHNDEIRLMVLESLLSQAGTDWFGVSEYLTMPTFLFTLFGGLGKLLGGIDLTSMRAVHAGFGVLIVVASYALFRSTASRLLAFGAACIVGINHSLWMLSRMALWDNSALFFELIALTVLIHGLKRRSPALSFFGGVATGAGFYVYLPARATLVIWCLMLVALYFYFRNLISRQGLLSLSIAAIGGCLLTIAPLAFTNTNQTGQFSTEYRYMLTPAGFEHQRLHALGASGQPEMSLLGGYLFNVRHGLTAFNNNQWDNGGMYTNPDHGFVDPLTGILVWIGLGVIALRWRRSSDPQLVELLSVIGFVSLWLALSFLINQAPNYTRMLGVLPFVGFLAANGLESLAGLPRRIVGRRIEVLSFSLRSSGFAVGLLLVGLLNLKIVGDYITFAWEDGSVRGSTARYVEARAGIPDYTYQLFASQQFPYYVWGEEREWREWISFFMSEGQTLAVEGPDNCADLKMNPPFTVFLSAVVWENCGPLLADEYPKLMIHYTHPNQSRLAVEVLDD